MEQIMTRQRTAAIVFVLILTSVVVLTPSRAVAQFTLVAGRNLIANPGFETRFPPISIVQGRSRRPAAIGRRLRRRSERCPLGRP